MSTSFSYIIERKLSTQFISKDFFFLCQIDLESIGPERKQLLSIPEFIYVWPTGHTIHLPKLSHIYNKKQPLKEVDWAERQERQQREMHDHTCGSQFVLSSPTECGGDRWCAGVIVEGFPSCP